MRFLALIILILGGVIAGGAVWYANNRYADEEAKLLRMVEEIRAASQTGEEAEQTPQIATTPVVVAAKAMRYGEALTADHVKVVEFPEGSVPPNAFQTLEDVIGPEGSQSSRTALRAIEANEPILKAKVTGFGERATISAQLTPGMRAFTLRIDTVTGVAGFLLPNDRVDIFLTRGDRNGPTSDLIMQNVKVIAVDQFAGTETSRARVARTATVEVSPEDAQKLALAQQVGRISLSLRQIDEVETTSESPSINLDDIIVREQAEPAPAPAPAPKRICTRKGTELFCQ